MPESLPITIKNQTILLDRLALGYKDLGRVLMEYIDNSLDSADNFYNMDPQKYERTVRITIKIDRHKKRVIITDNCEGMDKETLKRLAVNINDSAKAKAKKRPWVNGEFGLGAHAFRAFAQNLTVTSRPKGGKQATLYIGKANDTAELFDNYPVKQISLIDKGEKQTVYESGTIVEVGDIDKTQLKNLTIEGLKQHTESHFEMLLKRNVVIKIIDNSNAVVCMPFNYDDLEGVSISKTISSWIDNRGAKVTVVPEQAIELNLKVCRQHIDRPVYFVSRGRKIANVMDISSFRNFYHSLPTKSGNVWSNIFITGYIDVKEHLKPVIHRDDFESSQKRTEIYREVMKFNEEIAETIQREMKNKTNEGMRALGDVLTDILSKLAREDTLNLRRLDEISNEKSSLLPEVSFDLDEEGETTFIVPGGRKGSNIPIEVPGGKTIETKGSISSKGEHSGTPSKPKKQGMSIEFISIPYSEDQERAYYADGVIYIFTDHLDFQERVARTRGGELSSMKITPRLANYLAAIISSKYKEQFYQQKKLEPERNKVLDEQIDFIFRFEQLMQPFIDEKLDSFGALTND